MRLQALVIVATIALLPTLTSAAPPNKTPALAPLAWYDATGKMVGRTLSEPVANPWLAFSWGDDLVPIQLVEEPLGSGGAVFFYNQQSVMYSLPNCTGTVYLGDTLKPMLGFQRVAQLVPQPDGMMVYVTGRHATPVVRTFNSIRHAYDTCNNTSLPVATLVLDTEGSMNLTGLYTLPLYLK